MFAIARSEMTQLVRNRLVAASSLFIPLAFSAVLIFNRENFGGTPVTAALILVTVTAMGTYITATTTLASRRQNLFLKRLRSTSAKDASILSGLVLPIALVNLVQAGVIVAILSVVGTPPVGVVAVVAAVVVLELMFVGAAIATVCWMRRIAVLSPTICRCRRATAASWRRARSRRSTRPGPCATAPARSSPTFRRAMRRRRASDR